MISPTLPTSTQWLRTASCITLIPFCPERTAVSMKCASIVLSLAALLAASTAGGATPLATPATATSVNEIAEAYVKLVLAMGQHDPDYVDAYYGPPEWKADAERQNVPVAKIREEAARLIACMAPD